MLRCVHFWRKKHERVLQYWRTVIRMTFNCHMFNSSSTIALIHRADRWAQYVTTQPDSIVRYKITCLSFSRTSWKIYSHKLSINLFNLFFTNSKKYVKFFIRFELGAFAILLHLSPRVSLLLCRHTHSIQSKKINIPSRFIFCSVFRRY